MTPFACPIEEQGGYNLYAFCLNGPVYSWDVLGNGPQDNDSIQCRLEANQAAIWAHTPMTPSQMDSFTLAMARIAAAQSQYDSVQMEKFFTQQTNFQTTVAGGGSSDSGVLHPLPTFSSNGKEFELDTSSLATWGETPDDAQPNLAPDSASSKDISIFNSSITLGQFIPVSGGMIALGSNQLVGAVSNNGPEIVYIARVGITLTTASPNNNYNLTQPKPPYYRNATGQTAQQENQILNTQPKTGGEGNPPPPVESVPEASPNNVPTPDVLVPSPGTVPPELMMDDVIILE